MFSATRARGDLIGMFCGSLMKFKIFMILNFFEIEFLSTSELQAYLEKLQVGVLEAMARDEGSRCGVFPAARACGDIIRTFCSSLVKFYFS